MGYTVGQAIFKLLQAGVRTQRGYPGTLMPHLTGAVAAVSIHKKEPGKTTLVAEACAPMNQGVYACEDLAAKVVEAWTKAGAVCSYGSHRFDGQSGLYQMSVYGTWIDQTEEANE